MVRTTAQYRSLRVREPSRQGRRGRIKNGRRFKKSFTARHAGAIQNGAPSYRPGAMGRVASAGRPCGGRASRSPPASGPDSPRAAAAAADRHPRRLARRGAEARPRQPRGRLTHRHRCVRLAIIPLVSQAASASRHRAKQMRERLRFLADQRQGERRRSDAPGACTRQKMKTNPGVGRVDQAREAHPRRLVPGLLDSSKGRLEVGAKVSLACAKVRRPACCVSVGSPPLLQVAPAPSPYIKPSSSSARR